MKNKLTVFVTLMGLISMISCGGDSKLPEVSPIGPSADLSDSESLNKELSNILNLVGSAVNASEFDLLNDAESTQQSLQALSSEEDPFPYDLASEVPALSGTSSGTATFSGVVDGTFSEEWVSLTFDRIGITFDNYSEDGAYILDGTFFVSGAMNATESEGGNISLTAYVALVVSGAIGATIEGNVSAVGTFTNDDHISGTLTGSLTISSGGNSVTCTADSTLEELEKDDSSAFSCE